MSLKRIGVVMPTKNTPTLLEDVNTYYLASVVVTNVNPTETANVTIYVKPKTETDPTKYAYITSLFPLSRQNSFETVRFAMNPLDEIWVESTIEDVSFVAIGIPQSVIVVRYTVGPTAEIPSNPQVGDQFYDTTTNTLKLYKPLGWVTINTTG